MSWYLLSISLNKNQKLQINIRIMKQLEKLLLFQHRVYGGRFTFMTNDVEHALHSKGVLLVAFWEGG